MKRLSILLLLSWIVIDGLQAQILNDSTKTIYGPKTCNYTYFGNIKFNRPEYHHPDTTIDKFQDYSYVKKHENKLQDLGNIGSSATDIFYRPPGIIGVTSGYYTYQWYNLPIDKIKLYNTKSPYTDIFATLGGGYRYILNVTFSQNIKPNWNFGGNYQQLTINKQYSSTGRGDNQVKSTSYDGYMYYWTKDSTYFVFGAFTHMFHTANESGGIKNSNFLTLSDYFAPDVSVNLESANDAFLRNDFLVYQQYSLSPLLTVYNDFRKRIDHDFFSDPKLSSEGSYFDRMLISTDTTSEYGKYSEISNESGIKGIFFHKAFYNAYFRYRNAGFMQKYIPVTDKRTETYLGGNLRYDLDTTHFLMISGELMQNGDHRLGANYENKLWILSYRRQMYEPTFLSQNYFGNQYEWHNDFKPIQSDNATALLKFRIRKFYLMPELSLNLIKNYVYYGTDKMPAQAGGFAQLLTPGLKYDLTFGNDFHLRGEGLFTLKTGNNEASDAFRIPKIFVNAEAYYENILFDSNLHFIAGVDAHYQSAYFAYGYAPVIQQFYLQNDFELPAYLTTDAYINLGIGNFRLFIKMTYLNQKRKSGYFTTPYYIGQQRVLDFGVSWMFYD